ncbi:MAG TPA: ROK family transcriptional regulator [Bacillota bacterium]|nr:ROK family transcriptional regulator [Bacillota bacterium]
MAKVINQEYMRNTNKKLILQYIQKNGTATKPEIAAKLGISATSVSTFIRELTEEQFIIEIGNAKSTGGRKSMQYRINPNAFYIIGIDLQVDAIIGVLTNFEGELILSKEIPIDSTDEWSVLDNINLLVQTFISQKKIPENKLGGVGIAVPGIVQGDTGLIEFAPNLGWKNVNIPQAMGVHYPIFIENEANAAVVGEVNFGLAKNVSNVIFISIGAGVGCGIFLNGKLFIGASFHAGEFGHMIVEPQGQPCRCGNQGCWEVYTSNAATLRHFNELTKQPVKSYDSFLEAFLQNNPAAKDVMDDTIRYLGIGIANIANGLNPEMIVVGGKIAQLKEQIYTPLLKAIKDNCLDKTFSGLAVEFSSLNHLAGAFGMAGFVIDHLVSP